MAYLIKVKNSVYHDIRRIPEKHLVRILEAIDSLSENPRPRQSSKLKDTERTYRLRVGDYRVIYQIDNELKEVIVFHVRHRKDVYRYI